MLCYFHMVLVEQMQKLSNYFADRLHRAHEVFKSAPNCHHTIQSLEEQHIYMHEEFLPSVYAIGDRSVRDTHREM